MKQVISRQGKIAVEEVPAPVVQPGTILVQVTHSCISSGTELGQLRKQGEPLWRKALNKPQQVKKALEMVQREGVRSTMNSIDQKLKAPSATGYSLAGKVLEIGEGVSEFQPGDLVACSGAQCAHHAEIVCVPVNLAVKTQASPPAASTVALGAIALQSVRRLNPTLGETFLVTGLGILGQLTVQILKAAGCRVVAVDLNPARLAAALEGGADWAWAANEVDLPHQIKMVTGGIGADGAIITASGSSAEPLSQAFRACRKKARVVMVGDLPLAIDRAEIYEKEIDFLISTSYGPGRYDENFEEHGLDYPLPYVRWTETRNMDAYLALIEQKKIALEPLLRERFPVDQAPAAFARIAEAGLMTVVLEYPASNSAPVRTVSIGTPALTRAGRLGLGIIGAGSFTKAMHAPILKALANEIDVRMVVSRQGHKAKEAAETLGAAQASTDISALLADEQVQAVFIATRHNLHADLALKCLRAGKHVFLEKPTALNADELRTLRGFYAENPSAPTLFTGFNRRYSAAAVAAKEYFRERRSPMVVQYTMNAGYLPTEHWVHGPEGGGRNIGEACHAYDFFLHVTGAESLPSVAALAMNGSGTPFLKNDNFSATFRFTDGSIANLVYTAAGNPGLPKEDVKIFCENRIFRIADFKAHQAISEKGAQPESHSKSKGHEEEWKEFMRRVRSGSTQAEFEAQFIATEMSLLVEEQILRS